MQDWTRQVSEDAEGVVSFTYRTRPEDPPDVQQIQKQMAIVAWQRGPNRYIQVPSKVCQHPMIRLPDGEGCLLLIDNCSLSPKRNASAKTGFH